jgi:glucose-6-phosphate 1-dehydrogenase
MIERLLLFGATGDLAGRFLLPALAELGASGRLLGAFEVIGAARGELSAWAEDRVPLEEYPAGSPGPPRRRQESGGAEPPP